MIPHGSLSTYIQHRCRCTECRAANVAYNKAARQRRRDALDRGEVEVVHGVESTYFNYRCRCDECRAEHRRRQRERRARRKKREEEL